MRILLIEDEYKLAQAIAKGLNEEGYVVDQALDGTSGEAQAFLQEHDLIILDIMLPGKDGFEICQNLRNAKIATPILFLSARGLVEDRVKGLNLGGDDYLAKPFEFDELLARVRSLLRRYTPVRGNLLQAGALQMDLQSHTVKFAQTRIQLTQLEYQLLEYLLQHQGQVLSRALLAERVWADPDIALGTVDVYIGYLRNKIDKTFATHLIQTVRGLGYTLKPGADEE
jgi:DNA-binding response OmpR family regulator